MEQRKDQQLIKLFPLLYLLVPLLPQANLGSKILKEDGSIALYGKLNRTKKTESKYNLPLRFKFSLEAAVHIIHIPS